MNNLKKQGIKIGLLILGFVIYGLIVRNFAKSDTTSGGISLVMIIGGWVLFLYLLVKFIREIFKAPEKKADAAIATQQYYQNTPDLTKNESKNSRFIIYFVFLLFLGLLATSGNSAANFTDPLRISNAFGGWLWWISLLCFIVGLGGKRITSRFTGSTIDGTQVTGYIDHGAVKGTDGFPGAVALTLAYISVYIVWTMIAHWKFKKQFPDGHDTKLVIMVIIGAFVVIPLYLVLVKMIRSNNKVNWIVGGAWLVFLAIVARL